MYANAALDTFSISNRTDQLVHAIYNLRNGLDVLPGDHSLAEAILRGTTKHTELLYNKDQQKRRPLALGFYFKEDLASLEKRLTKSQFLRYFARILPERGFTATEEIQELLSSLYDILNGFGVFIITQAKRVQRWAQAQIIKISQWSLREKRADDGSIKIDDEVEEDLIELHPEIFAVRSNRGLFLRLASRLE